jgi:two-component system sensor histidine kinase PilS (NtrC family)
VTRTPPRPAAPATEQALRRELYFFTLYRALEAGLLALVVFSPFGDLFQDPRFPVLGGVAATGYLVAAVLLMITGRHGRFSTQALVGVAIDIVAAALAMHAMPSAASGIALMLLFNVGAAALFVPLRVGLGMAIAAGAALIGEYLWSASVGEPSARSAAELLMYTVSFSAVATLANMLGRQMRASLALADRKGAEAANLAEVSELIIRRMRTGVLMVDGTGNVRLANEAAMLLIGGQVGEKLHALAPDLDRRLRRWRHDGVADEAPMQLGADLPEIVPRFTRLLADSDQSLVFLDDTTLLSRRAESMTLATLGRFSASLAHEIRNPLAAISYATQLLEESKEILDADRRLLEIIHQQTMRMNGIVENVLGLARRERAQPEYVELVGFARRFIEEYRTNHPLEGDTLQVTAMQPAVPALADPRQLHQILVALVHNALTYGRMPGEPARVNLHISNPHGPQIDVQDRGPGIPEPVAAQLFRPFFTTSGHGTGLGLYIARELCRANQATLEYVAMPGGGSCFRIRLAGPHSLLPT